MDIYAKLRLEPAFPTLAQLLQEHGYATYCVTSNSWLSADFGLLQGFQTVHKQWQLVQTDHEINRLVLLQGRQEHTWAMTVLRRLAQGNAIKNLANAAFARLLAYRLDLGASRILRPFARWASAQERPWFGFVHFLEAHLPYRPPRRWAARFASDLAKCRMWMRRDQWRAAWRHIAGVERLSRSDLAVWRDLYLGEVAYADYHLGRLIDWLERTGQLDRTMVIVVADHGENLGEHGLLNHQYCVFDALLRVPLVIRYPRLFPRGGRVSGQVQTLDLFKTVLEVAGTEPPASASRSLLPGNESRPYVVAEYGQPRDPHPKTLSRYGLRPEALARFRRGFVTLCTDTHKLIVGTDGSVELYAWPSDPGEEHNTAAQHPQTVETLRRLLERWQETHGQVRSPSGRATQVSREVESRLRALGYMQ